MDQYLSTIHGYLPVHCSFCIYVCVGALLRSRLAIIPQDPFLFSGTVRENLDPCGRHRDQQLLDVLDQCHLGSVVARMGEREGREVTLATHAHKDLLTGAAVSSDGGG